MSADSRIMGVLAFQRATWTLDQENVSKWITDRISEHEYVARQTEITDMVILHAVHRAHLKQAGYTFPADKD